MMGPWYHWNGGGWWMMGIGMFFQIAFWALIIYLAVRFFRCVGLGGGCNNHRHNDMNLNINSAEEILRQRYARGEINRDEYEQMIEDLKK